MRPVQITLLPDGSGRIRTHWFQRDSAGPVKIDGGGRLAVLPEGHPARPGAIGRLACQPGRTDVRPKSANGMQKIVMFTDDPSGVSCPECMATEAFKSALAALTPAQAG
jgi:hypothetical protein